MGKEDSVSHISFPTFLSLEGCILPFSISNYKHIVEHEFSRWTSKDLHDSMLRIPGCFYHNHLSICDKLIGPNKTHFVPNAKFPYLLAASKISVSSEFVGLHRH
jgi:hypothetical protein